jgi:ceramide glucosyltransferase
VAPASDERAAMMWWASIAASLMAAIGCTYLIVAFVLVGRFARQHSLSAPTSTPSVTILKPLYREEPGLYDNLASFCRQDYPAPVQIIFGVQDAQDPAIAVVERLRQANPGAALDLVVDATVHGSNRKVSNFVNIAKRIRHDVVVLSDSDIRVAADYLRKLIATLAAPGVGAVTCLYRGVALGGAWSRVFALGIDAQFLPNVLVGLALGRAQPCFGSTIAMRRETLDAIGGFEAFVGLLADDYAIGEAVRARGLAVEIPPFVVAHVGGPDSLGAVWRHELRWARTIRSLDPFGYAGSVVAHPLPFALLSVALGTASGTPAMPLALVIAAAAARIALVQHIGRAFGFRPQSYWLVPARDLLSFAVFVASFFGRGVDWRGHRLRVEADGTLLPEGRSPKP